MSVLIGCLECAEAFSAQEPDLQVEVAGRLTDVYRCPACGELNLVSDTSYMRFISRADLAGLISPEQLRERRIRDQ